MSKILFADDCEDTRAVMSLLLESEGFDVASASNGIALERTVRSEGPFAALLLDFNMPDFDGVAFYRALQADASLRSVPTVFLTGLDARSIQAKLPGAAVLEKPLDVEELMRFLARVRRAA